MCDTQRQKTLTVMFECSQAADALHARWTPAKDLLLEPFHPNIGRNTKGTVQQAMLLARQTQNYFVGSARSIPALPALLRPQQPAPAQAPCHLPHSHQPQPSPQPPLLLLLQQQPHPSLQLPPAPLQVLLLA